MRRRLLSLIGVVLTLSSLAYASHDEIAQALARRKRLHFVEVRDVVVTELLPDDTKGTEHQKWMFEINNGEQIMAVYNSDHGDRVPLKVGDTISLAGEFLWTKHGGIIHWLHADDSNRRPDGWVEHNGEIYGESGERN